MSLPQHTELADIASLIEGSSSLATGHLNEIEPGEVIERINYHGLGGLVDSQTLKSLPELAQHRPLLAATESLRFNALNELFDAFLEAGLVEYCLIKGTALAYSVYTDPWQRPRTDTDLIIKQDDLAAFEAVFCETGYQRLPAISGSLISYQCTFAKMLVGDATMNIDVHWQISNRQSLARSITFEELMANSQQLPAFTAKPRIPSFPDCLQIACLHRLGHHANEERLAWLYDIHLLANTLDHDQWDSTVETIKKRKLSAICYDGIVNAERYFGTSMSETVLDSLNVDVSNDADASKKEPSAILLKRNLNAWQLFIHDVESLPNWQDKIRFILETAFPSPQYVKQRMQTESLLKAYLIRAIHGIKRMISK